MSRTRAKPRQRSSPAQLRRAAPIFAALGDPTRLALLRQLGRGEALSIARLADGLPLTRQAITKHLQVLEEAGLVRGVRAGREYRFAIELRSLGAARAAIDSIGAQWEGALGRLKAFVER
jgi:DNA-binding transcriptional ArsR family regulator